MAIIMIEKVFEIFKEICSIPHGSGNTKGLCDYCVNFANTHSLRYYRDTFGNVVIFKDATEGFERVPAVILQGHLDMVCVKTDESEIDFEKDGLKLIETDDFIFADGTSLGGDDGIAIAFCLAILESDSIAHPPLEVVFTVDEETGMYGAEALDTSVLSGKMMINIDSEEEGTLLVSCAGGVRADAEFETETDENLQDALKITLKGLTGGHSGTEIDKGRLNAITALAKLIKEDDVRLVSTHGGSADNAIAAFCSATITSENLEKTKNNIESAFERLRRDCSDTDKNIEISFEKTKAQYPLTKTVSKSVLSSLCEVPDGVISFSENVEGLVQTSLNLGIIRTDKNKTQITHALRSSVSAEKEELSKRIAAHYKKFGAKVKFHSDYPAWEFKENSILQKVITQTYKEIYGKQMNVSAIHAGLECGIFAGKIKDLDCVSLGPDIFDIHSVSEKLSKKSAERVFGLLVKVLSKLN